MTRLVGMQILKKTQEGVHGTALLECVQRRMESIALQLPAGSLEQRVQVLLLPVCHASPAVICTAYSRPNAAGWEQERNWSMGHTLCHLNIAWVWLVSCMHGRCHSLCQQMPQLMSAHTAAIYPGSSAGKADCCGDVQAEFLNELQARIMSTCQISPDQLTEGSRRP